MSRILAVWALGLLAGCGHDGAAPRPILEFSPIPCRQTPPARFDAAFTSDHARGLAFLFGGRGEAGILDDLWVFDADSATWSEVPFEEGPGALSGASLVWDEKNQRLVLFGGWRADQFGINHFSRELWIWQEQEGWHREFFEKGPGARAWHAGISSPTGVVVAGGYGGPDAYHLRDIWILEGREPHFRRLATDARVGITGRPELLVLGEGRGYFLFGRAGWSPSGGTVALVLLAETDTWVFAPINGALPPAGYDFTVPLASGRQLAVVATERPAGSDSRSSRAWLLDGAGLSSQPLAVEVPCVPTLGMRCVAHPREPRQAICFGGVDGDSFSAATWRVGLKYER